MIDVFRIHLNKVGLQKSIKATVQSCGIHKHITIHTFLHCYGANLVEAGVNLRAIQHQMGHECPKTTALSTQQTVVTHQDTGAMITKLVDRVTFVVVDA